MRSVALPEASGDAGDLHTSLFFVVFLIGGRSRYMHDTRLHDSTLHHTELRCDALRCMTNCAALRAKFTNLAQIAYPVTKTRNLRRGTESDKVMPAPYNGLQMRRRFPRTHNGKRRQTMRMHIDDTWHN